MEFDSLCSDGDCAPVLLSRSSSVYFLLQEPIVDRLERLRKFKIFKRLTVLKRLDFLNVYVFEDCGTFKF